MQTIAQSKRPHIVKTINDQCFLIEAYSDGACVLTINNPGYFEMTSELIERLYLMAPLRSKNPENFFANTVIEKVAAKAKAVLLVNLDKPASKSNTGSNAKIAPVKAQDKKSPHKPTSSASELKTGRWTLNKTMPNGKVLVETYPNRRLYRIAAQKYRASLV